MKYLTSKFKDGDRLFAIFPVILLKRWKDKSISLGIWWGYWVVQLWTWDSEAVKNK